jgi:hypothetical protein
MSVPSATETQDRSTQLLKLHVAKAVRVKQVAMMSCTGQPAVCKLAIRKESSLALVGWWSFSCANWALRELGVQATKVEVHQRIDNLSKSLVGRTHDGSYDMP